MARVSIYVSDELKARMTAVGDALNWSDIARPAFEAAIAAFNHRRKQSMQTAVERLRASKVKHEAQQEEEGLESGRDWAANYAEFDVLKRLSRVDTNLYRHEPDSIWQAIKAAADPQNAQEDRDLAEELFGAEELLGDAPLPDGEWLIAWVEGAQQLFSEVEAKL